MGRSKRSRLAIEASIEVTRIAAMLGRETRSARRRRHLTQAALGARVGLRQGRISDIERGRGDTLPLGTWVLLGLAVGRPVAVSLSRDLDPGDGLLDAGHLEIQEYLLARLALGSASRRVELPTRPADPSRSIDVCLRDDHRRLIVVLEAWNRIGDLGAAIRSTNRKLAEAAGLANALEGETGLEYRVAGCWILRATAANRNLVRAYPSVIQSALQGSSVGWVQALVSGSLPPAKPGVVWFDPARRKIVPIRFGRHG